MKRRPDHEAQNNTRHCYDFDSLVQWLLLSWISSECVWRLYGCGSCIKGFTDDGEIRVKWMRCTDWKRLKGWILDDKKNGCERKSMAKAVKAATVHFKGNRSGWKWVLCWALRNNYIFLHIWGNSLEGCGSCFYAPVLHGEWLSSKPWDSVSARKNVSAFNVKVWMSNFEIQQTRSLKKKQLSTQTVTVKQSKERFNWNSRMLCCLA